jgi:hypothetical protein
VTDPLNLYDPAPPISLEQALAQRAMEPAAGGKVWVDGGFVDRALSVPLHAGVAYLALFAARAWQDLCALQQQMIGHREALRQLGQAQQALRNLVEDGLDKDVAIALAAVQRAMELLG